MLVQREQVRLIPPDDRYEARPGWRQVERVIWLLLRRANDSRRTQRGWYGNSRGTPAGTGAAGR